MYLSDDEISFFDHNVLRLNKEKRDQYLRQVDNLIDQLRKKASEETFDVQKILKAGSLRKGTVLRPRGDNGVDADLAIYLTVPDAAQFDLGSLHARIRALLVAIYPQMRPEQFIVQRRTLGIAFRQSELSVDLVPVVPADGLGDYGWQPSSEGAPPVLTSIPGQLAFITRRAQADSRFRPLVRLVKSWRNQQELKLRSFAVELILAGIQDNQGPAASLESGLLRFFLSVARTELQTPISFPENGTLKRWPADPVVVLDPVNSDNNVTARLTTQERLDIVAHATEAWETLTTARRHGTKTGTLEYWKDVFGRSFRIEE